MFTKSFTKGTGTFAAYQNLAVIIQTGTPLDVQAEIARMLALPLFAGKSKQSMLRKLGELAYSGIPQYDVFKLDGNGKLPFVAFSSLPGATCPGAGACLDFCYSYRAWRFAHAFGRMAQNAFLMRWNRPAITAALDAAVAHFKGAPFDLRLYVDGDFASAGDVAYWMSALAQRPPVRAYGYSKSFGQLLAYDDIAGGQWPVNYILNMSAGHNHDALTASRVAALRITRGEFVAVSIGRTVRGAEHGTPAVNQAIRAAYGARVFPCPGACGTCTPKGHACGAERFRGIPIAIAMH